MDFRILGPLEVVDEARRVPLAGAKQRALLALLVIRAPEVLSNDGLIEALWGERPPASAAKSLQVHVSRLRMALEPSEDGPPQLVITHDRGYALAIDPAQVDSRRFESLVAQGRADLARGSPERAASVLDEALSLWRGPPLSDLAYESFVQPEVARLDELHLTALQELIDAKLALGRHAELVPEIETLVSENPYRERLRGQLMLALYRGGRQAEALQAYRNAQVALAEDLGLEPAPALKDLERKILQQDPALDVAPWQPSEQVQADATRTLQRPVLIGRDGQLSRLRAALDSAAAGRGSLCMIGGPPGIGKSRLADELARDARDKGIAVLWGRCWEAGGAPAYWPWVQVLRTLIQQCEVPSLSALGGGPGAAALVQLVPELGSTSADLPPLALESEGARFQLFDGAARLLQEASKSQPIMIVLDDLHAADTPSLLLLQFMAGQLGGSRILIVGLHRDEDLREDRSLTATLAAVAREPTTSRIELAGLRFADTSSLIESIVDHEVNEATSRRIQAETEGNPLFVSEIVRLLSAEGALEAGSGTASAPVRLPDSVTEVIRQRLNRLDHTCLDLLRGASILGREFGVRELAAVSEMDDSAVLETLDDAITARVLAPSSAVDRVRFSHALVRETLYGGLSAGQRREAHRRAAESLESLYASDPEPHLAELAHHFYEALPAGDPRKAVEYAGRAGRRAARLLAYEEAVRLFGLALGALRVEGPDADDERCSLLVALGDAEARAGDETAARATFLEAAELAREAALPLELARAALGYGGRFVWARAYEDTHLIPLLEEALASLPADVLPLRARLMARLSGALRDHPSRERRASLSAQAVDLARRHADPATLAYVLDGRYSALMWPENPAERLQVADEVVALAEQASDDERAIGGRIYRVIANMELGRMADAEADLEVAAERAAALRQPAQLWFTSAMRAAVALLHGRFDEAEPLIETALSLGERAQRRDALVSHRLQLFMLRRDTGGLAETEQLIDDAVAEFPTRPVFRCALSSLHADLARPARARELIDELAPHDFAAVQRDNEFLFSLGFAAEAAHGVDDVQSAAVLYDLLIPFAHLNASNADEIATGSVSRPLGLLATTLRRWDDAARHFEAALAHNSAMAARPFVAHTLYEYGSMLIARDDGPHSERGYGLLASARDEYEALGMTAWAARATAAADAVHSPL